MCLEVRAQTLARALLTYFQFRVMQVGASCPFGSNLGASNMRCAWKHLLVVCGGVVSWRLS